MRQPEMIHARLGLDEEAAMGIVRSERRLAAIMVADIVGYSRLIEADEAGTLAAIRSLRAEAIDPVIAEHQGRIVKLMGDGAIVEFASVVDAVAAAVAIQRAAAARGADVPPARRIVLRIGVNLGDVVVEGDDLLGDGVNVAARLEQLCEPGGVLVSGTAYDHLQGRLGLPLDFAGEQQVKNISRPVPAYRVRMDGGRRRFSFDRRRLRRLLPKAAALAGVLLLAAAGAWWLLPGDTTRARPSIAVLPFDNLGGDEATGRLADGITEDIITDLARFREFEVIARNSIAAYKGKSIDVKEVGSKLNVRYVLEGSIQRQGDQVRVTGQLIDVTSGAHVWSERWDRPASDVFEVQAELSQQVTGKLSGIAGTIIAADREAARRKRPSDLNAYDLFVLATEAKQKETRESIAECFSLLDRAIAIDPTFARAFTLRGSCHAFSLRFGGNWDEGYAHYLDDERKAVELDPLDADAHAGLGMALALGGDLKQGEAEFDKALSLNPNSADVLTRFAYWGFAFGRAEEGADAAERAVRLDPHAPAWALRFQSGGLFTGGRYAEAIRIRQRVPKAMFVDADYIELATYFVAADRIDEAKALAAEALVAYPSISIEGWTGDPGWADEDRKNTIALMRKAGFRACASDAEVKNGGIKVRLPECLAAAN